MTEAFILEFIPLRIAELGYKKYQIRYRDLVIEGQSMRELAAFNSLYFIVGNPLGVLIESDYGIYDTIESDTEENTHSHRGIIQITNRDNEKKRITFIEATIIN